MGFGTYTSVGFTQEANDIEVRAVKHNDVVHIDIDRLSFLVPVQVARDLRDKLNALDLDEWGS